MDGGLADETTRMFYDSINSSLEGGVVGTILYVRLTCSLSCL